MTRQEFIDDVTTFGDLMDIASDVGIDFLDDIVYDDERDEEIDEAIRDRLDHEYWGEIRDWLNNIETGFEWYRRDGDEYVGLCDEDFEAYKDDVERYLLDIEWFDAEEDEDDEDIVTYTETEENQDSTEDQPVDTRSLYDVFDGGQCAIVAMNASKVEAARGSGAFLECITDLV